MSNPERPPIRYETAQPLIRKCKQCGEVMTHPLKEGDKLFMFCSTACHVSWDCERAYKMKPPEELDGY